MSALILTDELGPLGRRRVRIATIVSLLVIAGMVALALTRLGANGQLEPELYTDLFQWPVWRRLLTAFWRFNLSTASAAMVLSLSLGLMLALGRLAPSGLVNRPVGLFVEFFRAVPVLLFIFLARFGLPDYGIVLDNFWYVVIALTAYHSAVLAEIYRAGILSLSRGQSEAALSLGMTYWQSMRLVIVPQAVRRMLPAIVSQLVTIIKDTTLAYIIGVPDMLREGRRIGEFLGNRLQTLTLVALIFILVNWLLSRTATTLERRARRRYGAASIEVAGGPEDLMATEEEAGMAEDAAGTR
jgi:glutamate transport system permease protein